MKVHYDRDQLSEHKDYIKEELTKVRQIQDLFRSIVQRCSDENQRKEVRDICNKLEKLERCIRNRMDLMDDVIDCSFQLEGSIKHQVDDIASVLERFEK